MIMEHTANILVVDDEETNRLILSTILGEHYCVHTLSDGAEALDYLMSNDHTELILTDVVMPNMDGFELTRQVKANEHLKDIPLLFLTSLDSPREEEYGLSLGAADFIHKPISPPVVLARVRNHLILARTQKLLQKHNNDLESLVAERTREVLQQSEELMHQRQRIIAGQSATISAFCALAEARDNETGNHIRRTQNYVKVLALALRARTPRYRFVLDDERIELLYKSAPLHDVGKVGIPDRVLLKPGKLDPQEWAVMQRHVEFGYNAITRARATLGEDDDFLQFAGEIAYGHHEKWDGSGYPRGLAGEDIPLSARLMAVADVYDALISRRVYKPPFPHEQAIEIITEGRGRHFDPDLVDALLDIQDQFRRIAQQFNDD
jgi:putative two-component system response regulator